MDYRPAGDPDPACLTGQGDITEVTTKVCRANPTGWPDRRDGIEAPCLFPFTLNGKSHSSCIMEEIEDFARPVFRCPIRTVKGVGSNYNTSVHELGTSCPTNRWQCLMLRHSDTILSCSVGASLSELGQLVYVWEEGKEPVYGPNGELELDPDNQQCPASSKRPLFATCKNNCPGGE